MLTFSWLEKRITGAMPPSSIALLTNVLLILTDRTVKLSLVDKSLQFCFDVIAAQVWPSAHLFLLFSSNSRTSRREDVCFIRRACDALITVINIQFLSSMFQNNKPDWGMLLTHFSSIRSNFPSTVQGFTYIKFDNTLISRGNDCSVFPQSNLYLLTFMNEGLTEIPLALCFLEIGAGLCRSSRV